MGSWKLYLNMSAYGRRTCWPWSAGVEGSISTKQLTVTDLQVIIASFTTSVCGEARNHDLQIGHSQMQG